MQVNKLQNGQIEVKDGDLTLIQTTIGHNKYNDCSVFNCGTYELISQHDPRLKPLFIALHNFKTNN